MLSTCFNTHFMSKKDIIFPQVFGCNNFSSTNKTDHNQKKNTSQNAQWNQEYLPTSKPSLKKNKLDSKISKFPGGKSKKFVVLKFWKKKHIFTPPKKKENKTQNLVHPKPWGEELLKPTKVRGKICVFKFPHDRGLWQNPSLRVEGVSRPHRMPHRPIGPGGGHYLAWPHGGILTSGMDVVLGCSRKSLLDYWSIS